MSARFESIRARWASRSPTLLVAIKSALAAGLSSALAGDKPLSDLRRMLDKAQDITDLTTRPL